MISTGSHAQRKMRAIFQWFKKPIAVGCGQTIIIARVSCKWTHSTKMKPARFRRVTVIIIMQMAGLQQQAEEFMAKMKEFV